MTLSEGVWPKVCEKLIKSCVIPEEKIKSFRLNSHQHNEDNTVLQIDTDEDKYELLLSLSTYLKNSESVFDNGKVPAILIEDEKVQVNINKVCIEGYKPHKFERVNDIAQLKLILEALAFNHSRCIESCDSLSIKNNCNYSLVREDYKKILSVLYEVIEKADTQEVDGILFKESVETLYYSSEDIFTSTEKNILVPSSVLQSRFFFKFSDSEVVKCKIINIKSKTYLPLVYDVLLCIFFFSTEKMRQHHFHELLDYYYEKLQGKLQAVSINLPDILSPQKYEELLKIFNPFSKMEVALFNCQQYLRSLKILDDEHFITNIVNIFESDTSCLNSLWKSVLEIYDFVLYTNLSREDCYKVVESKVGSKDYEFLNWQLIPLEKRSGYLGDYYNLTINIKFNEEEMTLKLFAKYLPTYNEVLEKIAKVSFEKEVFFYVEFLSELKSVGLEEITDFLPKCYFVRPDDVIVLEDMAVLNYKQPSQGSVLSYECLLLVIKQLAKMHASSLLYEEIVTEKSGRTYRIHENFSRYLKEALVLDVNGQPQKIFLCAIAGALNYLLDVFPDIPKKHSMEKFKEKLKNLYDDMLYDNVRSNKFRNVITHGDLWGNNILFKGNSPDTPTDCSLIDYQLVRYRPPSHDLLFFLYVNTDKKARVKYMSRLLHDYYMELSRIFKKYNFDLSKIYTYESFLESCEFVKTNAVCMASLYLQMVLYPPEKMQKILKDSGKLRYVTEIDRKEILDEVYVNPYYKQRIREIVEDLYEICDS